MMAYYNLKASTPAGPRASSPGSDGDTTKKPKFDKDFIILSEFSEQVGPVPLEIYPDEKAKGSFDTNQFSVRIMSSDFQSSSGKLVGEDSQVLLSEKQDCAFAYVHYFSLNDIHARGFIRQLCFSYMTSSPRKLLDNFEEMKRQFSEVTSMLRCCNLKVFKRDLTQHLADLIHTRELLEEEGLTQGEGIDTAGLYDDYDFSKEDVPERDPEQVRKSIDETTALLEAIKVRMSEDIHQETWKEIKKQRRHYEEQQVLRDHQRTRAHLNESPIMRKTGAFTSYLIPGNIIESPDSGAVCSGDLSESYSSELTNSTSSGDLSHYEPRRVMTHIVQRFERRLRSLTELAPKAHLVAVEKIKEIHRYFHRSELVLEMEKDEQEFLDPRSSLLTIGRVPMMNALQNYSRHFACQQPPIVHAQRDYQLACKNTCAFPCVEGEVYVIQGDQASSSNFDTTFLDEKSNLNRLPLYLDPLPKTIHFGQPTDSFTYSENFSETDGDPTASLHTPQADHSGGETTDSATNAEGSSLAVPHDEDKVSHGSRSSTAFATPKTGMTPTSSENEADAKDEKRWSGVSTEGSSRNSTLNRPSNGVDGQMHEQSPDEHGAIAPQSNEGERESNNSLASISTPSLDRLQLPTPDRPLEKSDDHSCSTLTGSQGSLLLNDNASKTTNLQQGSANSSLGPITFNSKTATASPRVTKAVAKASGVANQDQNHLPSSGHAFVSINSTDTERYSNGGQRAWSPDEVINSATFSSRPFPPVSSSVSTNERYPQQSTTATDRTDSHEIASVAIDGELEEESHSAGSGSFSSTLVDTITNNNHTIPPPPYNHHTVYDAHTLLPDGGNIRPHHSNAISTGISTRDERPPATGTTSSSSRSNGMVPRFEQAEQKGKKMFLPRKLSLVDQEWSSPDLEQYYSPMSLPANTFSMPGQATAAPSSSTGTAVHIPPRQHPLSPGLTSVASMSSLVSNITAMSRSSYRGPSIVEIRGKGKLPLISSVDQVEGPYKFKPGKGIITFCRDHPNFGHLLYCLLHGRPLIILGKPSDKDMIRRLIRVLWLFVPGHSSQHQVIPWQEKALDIRDLSRVKLVGLNSQVQNSLGSHLKNYVSYWDCTAGKLHTPHYDGDLLKPITTRNRDRKTEEVFLTYIHSVLADISMKAYVYYHGFCANLPLLHSGLSRQPSASEPAPHKYHKVSRKEKTRVQFLQKMGIKGCDADIIENLVEVIREQQLAEWNGDCNPVIGTLQDDYPYPVTLKLHTRLCTETYCKPKRPY